MSRTDGLALLVILPIWVDRYGLFPIALLVGACVSLGALSAFCRQS